MLAESQLRAISATSRGLVARANALLWAAGVGVVLVAIAAQFLAHPELALTHWYLLSVPLIVGAFRFGLRGASITGIGVVAVFMATFSLGAESSREGREILEQVVASSTSPQVAQDFALRVADLSSGNSQTVVSRSFLGLILAILGSLLMGQAVDTRKHAMSRLEDALRLRRYVSPPVAEMIESRRDLGGLSGRKEITLLFSDLREFTAFSERTEPEELVQLLNEYFTAMTDVILQHGGTVDKYIGDGVMAFFGDPKWYADHAERAFTAAIAMQERMRELQSQWKRQAREGIAMGVGISTGYVTVGSVGSPQLMGYTAVGSTVNVAARLSELAGPGQILTTPKTYWRVERAIVGSLREPTRVKGFPQPVDIVEIRGARAILLEEDAATSTPVVELVSRVVSDPAYRAELLETPEEPSPQVSPDPMRSLAQQVAILCGHPVFQGVPAEEIAALMEAGSIEAHGPGTVVVHQGLVEDKFYIILQGEVAILVADERDREIHVASLARGDYFGELSLLFDCPRTATVRTLSACRFLVLHRDNFYRVLHAAPTFRARVEETARTRVPSSLAPRVQA